MIFKTERVIFVHIPKTGGSTIEFLLSQAFRAKKNSVQHSNVLKEKALAGFQAENDIGGNHHIHRFAKYYFEHVGGQEFQNYFRFSVIRNPFEQIRSLFKQLTQVQKGDTTFEQFITCESDRNIETFDFYVDQCQYIYGDSGEQLIDQLYPFDHLSVVLSELGERFQFTPDKKTKLWATKPQTLNYSPRMIDSVMQRLGDTYELYRKTKTQFETSRGLSK